MIHFIKIQDIFSSRLPCTPKEDVVIVSTLNLYFVRNLSKGDEIEMDSDLPHNMFKVVSIFFLVSTEWSDVLALGNTFMERDIWKGNVEDLELKCSSL